MLKSVSDFNHFKIHGVDGDIGEVTDFYFDDEKWAVRYLVVNAGSWLVRNQVLVSPLAIRSIDWDEKRIDLSLTRDQIANSPDISTDMPVSRQQEMEYYSYYRWPYYWSGAGIWGTAATLGMYPGGFSNQVPEHHDREGYERTSPPKPDQGQAGDPHLRSAKELRNYHIQSPDGEFGHVDGFVLDEQSLEIRYLIVDTRNWWPSKHVLISREWISEIAWAENLVYVDMDRETIRSAPEFDRHDPVTREYEARLHDHYGHRRYWENAA